MSDNIKSTITVPADTLERIHRIHGKHQDFPAKVALNQTIVDALDSLSEQLVEEN